MMIRANTYAVISFQQTVVVRYGEKRNRYSANKYQLEKDRLLKIIKCFVNTWSLLPEVPKPQ